MREANAGKLATLVFVFAFCLYAITAPPVLHGYEPQTAAVVEGFVQTGDFKILDHPFTGPLGRGQAGKGGKQVGRVGLPQPLFETPFYLAGYTIDTVAFNDTFRWRLWTVLFYNPFVTALTAALILLIAVRLGASAGWAVAVALLFTVASMAWPYSQIGMDATCQLGMAAAFLGAVATRQTQTQRLWPWLLAGFGAGIAVAAKQYMAPAALALLIAALPPLREPDHRTKRLVALAAPFAGWMLAMAWYDWDRFGSLTEYGNAPYRTTWAAPFNAAGLIASPGKGLLLYSPLTILGAIGIAALWQRRRHCALAITASFAFGVVAVALTPYWTDETWGPRYLLPVAWLLLLGLPWFATTRRRKQVLAVVAVAAVGVQLVAIAVPYSAFTPAAKALTGYPLYQERGPGQEPHTPFGHDSVRWIPQLSPLLVQTAMVASAAGQHLFGSGPVTLSYKPYEGAPRKLVIDRAFLDGVGAGRVNFWWVALDAGRRAWIALLAATIALLAIRSLYRDSAASIASARSAQM